LLQAVPQLAHRGSIVPIRDYLNTRRWAKHLGIKVCGHARRLGMTHVCLFCELADPSLPVHFLPESWEHRPQARAGQCNASHLRQHLFASACAMKSNRPISSLQAEEILAPIANQLPPCTLEALRGWIVSDQFLYLVDEWQVIDRYRRSWANAPYQPIGVTTDAVVQCGDRILLVRRGRSPGLGLHALPGGYVDATEPLLTGMLRELKEETGLELSLQQLDTCLQGQHLFDHPQRSERGRVITQAYYFRLPIESLPSGSLPAIQAGDDAAQVDWVPLTRLIELESQFHDDHFMILDHFLNLL
jgi:bifunctional NMN adenylyltransferase/nudix hydrolase